MGNQRSQQARCSTRSRQGLSQPLHSPRKLLGKLLLKMHQPAPQLPVSLKMRKVKPGCSSHS